MGHAIMPHSKSLAVMDELRVGFTGYWPAWEHGELIEFYMSATTARDVAFDENCTIVEWVAARNDVDSSLRKLFFSMQIEGKLPSA